MFAFQNRIVLIQIISIFGFSYAQHCQDIDSTETLQLRCNDSSTVFYFKKSGQPNEIEITFQNNPNPNKYSIATNQTTRIKTLTIRQFDKYDSGSDTYYTKEDNDPPLIFCTFDILIFSEYSLITISVISI